MKKVGILLTGCGRGDGSEVHEATLTILHVVKSGCQPVFFAPNEIQAEDYDHATDASKSGTRNCLVEAARISRGNILDIKNVSAADFDALILPGGRGAVLNLLDGETLKPEALRVIRETHESGKPIGFVCIAPLAGAYAFKALGKSITITIGDDPGVAAKIEACGHTHKKCSADDVVIDKANRVVSTPAYMTATDIAELDAGIGRLVAAVVELA